MASQIRINMANFVRRKDDYIIRVSRQVPEASRVGREVLISELMARAPSPAQEEALMNGQESYNPAFAPKLDDNREKDRDRFFHGPGTYPIQVALGLNQVWTITAQGFHGPSITLMDKLTRYSWTNVQRDRKTQENTKYTYTSTHGTFIPIEYGLAAEVVPKHGKKFLSPAPYTYAESVFKSVPAQNIVRGIDPDVILQAMAEELRAVKF